MPHLPSFRICIRMSGRDSDGSLLASSPLEPLLVVLIALVLAPRTAAPIGMNALRWVAA